MSLRYLLPLLFLLFCQFALPAQRVTVSEGISLRNINAYDLLGHYKGFFLVFQDYTTEFEVQALDEQLRKRWEKEIILDERRPQVLDVLSHEDHFSVLYSYRLDNDTHVKVHRYNTAANLVDSATLITFDQLFFTLPHRHVVSEDQSKVLLYRIKGLNEVSALCIDLNTQTLLWETEFQPDGMIPNRDLLQVLVDDYGNMCFALDKDNRKEKPEEHYYEMYFNGEATGKVIQRVIVPMRNILTFDVLFSFDNLNRYLVGAGLYFQDSYSRAEGSFFLRFPLSDMSKLTLRADPFEDKFVSVFLGKDAPKKNKGVFDTEVREIVHRRDGGILLIGERIKVYERNLTGGAPNFSTLGGRFVTNYYFDDLFVLSIHPDGLMHWKTVMHKKQFSQDDDAIYSSYFLFKTPTSLRFVFNDEIKFENTVSEYILRGDGGYDRNAVLSTHNQKIRLRFLDAVQISSHEFIIPSERRNKLRLVKVSY